MPTDLVTDSGLLERLSAAAQRGVTTAQRKQQRLSFVYANLPKEVAMTKHDVKLALDRLDQMEGRS